METPPELLKHKEDIENNQNSCEQQREANRAMTAQ